MVLVVNPDYLGYEMILVVYPDYLGYEMVPVVYTTWDMRWY